MANKLTPSLHLKQSQQLVMTPQLQQAIKLLQMSNLELDVFLEDQIAHNPLLEKAEGAPSEEGTETETSEAPQNDDSDSMDQAFGEAWENDTPQVGAPTDFDAGSMNATSTKGGSFTTDEDGNPLEETVAETQTLRDHLTDQLRQEFDEATDRALALLLVDMLDEAGYLRADPAELAARLACPPERLNAVLNRLRTFDPPGIFARDLADCLGLQLKDRGMLDAPFEKLLANLNLVAEHDHKKLAQICAVNETYLKDMLAELKTLNPKPSGEYAPLLVQTAIPDVLMKTLPKTMGGGWRVELNSETLPRVLVNETYYKDVLSHAKTPQDKTYLSERMADAHWLVRALDQRAQTILKVASDIVERQNAFFLFGIEYLAPLTLREVAETIDMHESTVSRVTTGKFIGTPRGIFELKFFFTTALAGMDGGTHSAESVRARIKTLIEDEGDAILSDDALAAQLKKEGIDIARRTVAKYREGMRIPSSGDRKKIKRNQAAT